MPVTTYHRPMDGYVLNPEQGRCRIGLLALVNDYIVERDMMTMRPDGDEVMIFTSRVPFEGDIVAENLAAMTEQLADVTDMILPGGRLDAVIYSCTSGTAAIGHDNVAKAIHSVRPDAHCITPIAAAHDAFRVLGLTRIAVLTPYSDPVTRITVDALEGESFQAVKVSNFGITVSDDISAVAPDSIFAGAVGADHSKADGLFISCTDFRAVQVIDQIEQAIGKPVVTANQATFRQSIRVGGYEKPIRGYGRLLEI